MIALDQLTPGRLAVQKPFERKLLQVSQVYKAARKTSEPIAVDVQVPQGLNTPDFFRDLLNLVVGDVEQLEGLQLRHVFGQEFHFVFRKRKLFDQHKVAQLVRNESNLI